MSVWGLATTALLLCYRVASLSHTHKKKKCFSLSLWMEERWHLNCHWGEGKVVSQGSRGQLLCWMVFEWLENKSYRDEISCCCHVIASVCATLCLCVSTADAIEMPPHIDNMFLQIVSLRQGQTDAAAFSSPTMETPSQNGHSSGEKGERIKKVCISTYTLRLEVTAQLCK